MSFPPLYYHFSSDPEELSDICQTALNFTKLIAVILVSPVLVAQYFTVALKFYHILQIKA